MTDIHFRSKRVCMNLTDWAAFAAAIDEANPEARYLRSLPLGIDVYGAEPPKVEIEGTFAEFLSDPDVPWEITMIIDPTWQGSWKLGNGGWYVSGPADLVTRFILGGKVVETRPKSPSHISHGEITVNCRPGRREHFNFAQRLFRLLKRFATNTNQISYSYPDYEVRWTQGKGNLNWLGHDAIRWAREDKRRMLCYERRGSGDDWVGWGLRPNDDGIVKP